jgi:hypothetical protein
MAKFKNLLKKVSIKNASRKRKCYHDPKHQILKDDLVLEIDGGFSGTSGYCAKCAVQMLRDAKQNITDLEYLLNR